MKTNNLKNFLEKFYQNQDFKKGRSAKSEKRFTALFGYIIKYREPIPHSYISILD